MKITQGNLGFWPRISVKFLVLMLALLFAVAARAQDIVSQFPEANQVIADYPDDAQRFVALNTLWDWLHAKAPEDAAARARRATYYNASTMIQQRYQIAGAASSEDFANRIEKLDTRDFKSSVLEHYHVLDIANAAGPAFNPNGGDVTDDMIKHGFLMASPFVIAGFVAMWIVCFLMLRWSSVVSVASTPPLPGPPGLPALPENLRVVRLPGMSYAVESLSGLVIDKETSVHTVTTTTTVPGQTQVVGNQVYADPARTYTNTTSTRHHTVWVRTPDGREEAWSFTGDGFQMRPSHLLSVIDWRLADGKRTFMLGLNHTTGQFTVFTNGPHGTRGCLAWFIAFLVGTIPFAIAVAVICSIDKSFTTTNGPFLLPTYLIMGAMGALVAATLVMFNVSGGILKRRNAAFNRNYLPGLRAHLESVLPSLKRIYGIA
jgi:hypothetical protein